MAPLLRSLDVKQCILEVPVEDFEHLPRELGCSLHRHGDVLTLGDDQPGCELHFRVEGPSAWLERISLQDDPFGRFFRDVVGLLLQLYSGDLEATIEWDGDEPPPREVVVLAGETSHPLLFQHLAEPAPPLVDVDLALPLIEQWLHDAQAAWDEYQRLKASREKQSQSLT
ncbi:MAG: hypothetical protein ACOZQL_26790 [Myxococcota bacterium]